MKANRFYLTLSLVFTVCFLVAQGPDIVFAKTVSSRAGIFYYDSPRQQLDTLYQIPRITKSSYCDSTDRLYYWTKEFSRLGYYDLLSGNRIDSAYTQSVVDVAWDVRNDKVFYISKSGLYSSDINTPVSVGRIANLIEGEHRLSLDASSNLVYLFQNNGFTDSLLVYNYLGERVDGYVWPNIWYDCDKFFVSGDRVLFRGDNANTILGFQIGSDTLETVLNSQLLLFDFELIRSMNSLILSVGNRSMVPKFILYDLDNGTIDTLPGVPAHDVANISYHEPTETIIFSSHSSGIVSRIGLDSLNSQTMIEDEMLRVFDLDYDTVKNEVYWINCGYSENENYIQLNYLDGNGVTLKTKLDLLIAGHCPDEAWIDVQNNTILIQYAEAFYLYNLDGQFLKTFVLDSKPRIELILPNVQEGTLMELLHRDQQVKVYDFDGRLLDSISIDSIAPISVWSAAIDKENKVLAVFLIDGSLHIMSLDESFESFSINSGIRASGNGRFESSGKYLLFERRGIFYRLNLENRRSEIYLDINDFGVHSVRAFRPFSQATNSTAWINHDTDVRIYPNPSSGIVEFVSSNSVKFIRLYDLSGRLMQEWSDPQSTRIHISHKGPFHLVVQTDYGIYVETIIVE